MAKNMIKSFVNHPVVELTRVQAVKDGHHFTQYPIATDVGALENGMLVAVDHIAGTVKKAEAITEEVYLHASVEKLYNGEGRDQFVVNETDDFLPRVYEMQIGDKFETNAIVFDDTETTGYAPGATATTIYSTVATSLAGDTAVYATVCVETGFTGYIELLAVKPTAGTILQVEKVVTLPNGSKGMKFVCIG